MNFKPGDRVRTTRDVAYYLPIPAGSTGTVVRASTNSHATANGGGYDIDLLLDSDAQDAERAVLSGAAMRKLHIDEPYIQAHRHEVRVRSTALELAQQYPTTPVQTRNALRQVRLQAYATHLRDCERCRIAMSRAALCPTGRELA